MAPRSITVFTGASAASGDYLAAAADFGKRTAERGLTLVYGGAVIGDADAPRWPSLPPFLRSIATIRTLGVVRVFPGHGDIIESPEVFLGRFETHHARRGAKVRAALAYLEEATAYEIVRSIFPRLTEHRVFQAMTEVLGHLDLLAERGEASGSGTPTRWKLTDGR